MTGEDAPGKGREVSWQWYLDFIQGQAAEVKTSLLDPVFRIPGESGYASFRVALCSVLAAIARCLLDDDEISLKRIATRLKDQGLIQLRDGHDELRAVQLAFQMTGWLTALWDPLGADGSLSWLELKPPKHPLRRPRGRHVPVVRERKLPTLDVASEPLYRTAGRFGNLVPTSDLRLDDDILGSRDVESACVTTAYVSYHSLKDIVNVNLEWTGILGQHLEYDQRQKALYVFKYPSICMLLYRQESKTLLSEMFRKYQLGLDGTDSYAGYEKPDFEDYLRGVLLSYRLIFALDRRSRRGIEKKLGEMERCDPLLKTLCTVREKSEEIKTVYDKLDAEGLGNENYVSIADFPFLEKRLIKLQRVNIDRNPHSFRRLWNDRRNPGAWFAMWAVLIVGGLTLVFQLGQLVFQIYPPFQ